jgi:hypothetical protein
MQPMGRKPRISNTEDRHPRRNGERVLNWWESESISGNKKAARQLVKKQIQCEQKDSNEDMA